ncbi:MAG: hypothetical protein ACJATI_003637 [Halioglobus sp.]|jgi:hypothetical protein
MENKEKYLIDQINNHRESVDTDDLWANVVGAIPQKEEKRKRGIIWFWGGLFLFSLISLFGYMLIDKSEEATILNELQNNEVVVGKISPPIISLTKHEESNDIVNEELKENGLLSSSSQIDKTRTTKKETKEMDRDQVSNNRSLQNEIVDTPISTHDNAAIDLNSKILDDRILAIEGEYVSYKEDEFINESKQDFEAKVGMNRVENIAGLSPLELNNLNNRRKIFQLKGVDIQKVDLITEQSMKVNKWSVFLNTGASFITRNLTTSDAESIDPRDRRDQIEKVLGGWDMSAEISYILTPSISIASGFMFGQIHERSTYTTSYLIESEGEQITSIIHTQDGSVNSVTENVKSYTNRETNEIRNNTFGYFSIPVTLKYRLIENDTYRLSLNGTFAYSFSQRYSGFTSLDANQPAYDLALDTKNNFNRSGALAYGLGLDVSRRLSPNWDMNFGISTRRLQGITSNTNLIDQKYNLYTLTFGVSRKI